MSRIKPLYFILLIALVSCSKKQKEVKDNDYHRGKLTLVTDDSFRSLAEAIADAYEINYPDTEVDVKVQKEDLAFLGLLKGENQLVLMSKILSDQEKAEYERVTSLDYKPAPIAADAVVFIVDKGSAINSISEQQILKELKSERKRLIFDGSNSGNLNFVASHFDLKPKDLSYATLGSNDSVVSQLGKFPDNIGVIGLNTISRPYDKQAQNLRNAVKILTVEKDGIEFKPEGSSIGSMKYPFTRVIYLLANERSFGIANGVMRFASSQKGQIVASKEGLQPYYLIPREVQMR